MYANADSLADKVQELKFCINDMHSKPHIIALTEIKHKNKWNIDISELQIEGYTIYSNNLQDNGRGIVNYVRHDTVVQIMILSYLVLSIILVHLVISTNSYWEILTAQILIGTYGLLQMPLNLNFWIS